MNHVMKICFGVAVTVMLAPVAGADEFKLGGKAYGRGLSFLAHLFLGDGFGTFYDLATIEDFAQLHGRLLHPDEIAAAIAWLCSRDSSALTGAVLPTDAGLTA